MTCLRLIAAVRLSVQVAVMCRAPNAPMFQDTGEEFISFLGNLSRDEALGDLDANGTMDAVVAQGRGGSPQAHVIRLKSGSGLFTESDVPISLGDSRSVALRDLDSDGDLDA